MANTLKSEGNPSIPVQLTETEFNEFILEHLPAKGRGPFYKISRFKVWNYQPITRTMVKGKINRLE